MIMQKRLFTGRKLLIHLSVVPPFLSPAGNDTSPAGNDTGGRPPADPPRAAAARCGRQGVSTDDAAARAATPDWDRYVGDSGAVVGMPTSGASAPLKELLTKSGLTPG